MKGNNFLKGIDISNNNEDINFNNIVDAGIEVVYIKASEGMTFKDMFCTINYNMAKERNLKVGFYHFLVASSEPERQAVNFYECIKNKKHDCLCCLDVEIYFNGINDYIRRFINKFKALTGEELLIYTGLNFGNVYISDLFINNKFWLAHYTNIPNNYGKFKFDEIIGHQYTDRGKLPNCTKNFDFNIFTKEILLNAGNENTEVNGKIAELKVIANKILGCNLKIDNEYNKEFDNILKKLPLCGVPYVQRDLTRWVQLRVGCKPDGIFYTITKDAVLGWQYSHGLLCDGIVGYNTYKSLCLA